MALDFPNEIFYSNSITEVHSLTGANINEKHISGNEWDQLWHFFVRWSAVIETGQR